jgi:hypothetical protein
MLDLMLLPIRSCPSGRPFRRDHAKVDAVQDVAGAVAAWSSRLGNRFRSSGYLDGDIAKGVPNSGLAEFLPNRGSARSPSR